MSVFSKLLHHKKSFKNIKCDHDEMDLQKMQFNQNPGKKIIKVIFSSGKNLLRSFKGKQFGDE